MSENELEQHTEKTAETAASNNAESVTQPESESAQKSASSPLVDARFELHLTDFEGPLDLLLHLISREEFNIFDIPIARLTQAYLDVIETWQKELDIEPASEFLLMIATLIHIKSQMLLPKDEQVQEATEEEDPREKLVFQLLEYQRFKEVAEELGSKLRESWEVFTRPAGLDRPEESEDPELCSQDAYRLGEAFRSLVAKSKYRAPHDIYVERVSIGERIAQIADLLALCPQTTFEELCLGLRYREEHVTSFLAILEMSRLKLVMTNQADRLGVIRVQSRVDEIAEKGERAAGMLTE